MQRSASLTETLESASSSSHTDVVDTQDNWLNSLTSATDTPCSGTDTGLNTVAGRLSPGSKLPLTSTRSAPESLTTKPTGKPDVVSDSADVSSSSDASSEMKPIGQLPATHPSKCKYVVLLPVYT